VVAGHWPVEWAWSVPNGEKFDLQFMICVGEFVVNQIEVAVESNV
jgi:hypothetical protein